MQPGGPSPRAARPVSARSLAADVLVRVWRDGAFAAAALDAALTRATRLEPRDRALATELVYGSLRTAAYLETRLAAHAKRGLAKLDAETRAHLVVAAYQIVFLDRVPAFAAVSQAVALVKASRNAALGGFANAVLRRLADEIAKSGRPDPARAALASASPELRRVLARALGDDAVEPYLAAAPMPPPTCARLRAGADRDAALAELRAALPEATVEPGKVSPRALVVTGGGDPHAWPGYREGRFVLQEEGSQIVAAALGAREGERVLDACAGRGNKTSALAEAVGPAGAVVASDVHPGKLERLAIELARVGLAPAATFATDWTLGPGDVPAGFDRVLVDAPCSGIGTTQRRPDLLARRDLADLGARTEAQATIVKHAATRLRPGGTLVYAVCSVSREEGEDVVARLAEIAPDLVPAPLETPLAQGAATLRLLPHVHGTDGYFLAAFRARQGAPRAGDSAAHP